MNRLKVVREQGDNSYCGPASLSIITGQPVSEITRILREVTGRTQIKGCYNSWLDFALRKLDYVMVPLPTLGKSDKPTVAKWLKEHKDRPADTTYLLNVTNHYIVIRGRKIADNHNPNGVFLRQYGHRRKRVVRAWRISPPSHR